MKRITTLLLLLVSTAATAAPYIQNSSIMSLAQLISAGGTAAQLPNSDKEYEITLAEQFSVAITKGDIANKTVPMILGQQVTPANPLPGFDKLYAKSDDKIYRLSSSGSESLIGPVTGTVTSVTGSNPIFSSGGSNPNITISQSSSLLPGFLSSADWITFNNKQSSGNYITALNNDVTATGPGSVNALLSPIPNKVWVDFLSGNDGNTGTIRQPWKTLQHACNSIVPTITEPYTIYLSGGNNDTDSVPITCPPNINIVSDYAIVIVPDFSIVGGVTDDAVTTTNVEFLGAFTWVRNDTSHISFRYNNTAFFGGLDFEQQGSGVIGSVISGMGGASFLNGATIEAVSASFDGMGTTFGTINYKDSGSSFLSISGGTDMSATIQLHGGITAKFAGLIADFGYAITGSTTGSGTPSIQSDSGSLPPLASITGSSTLTFSSLAPYVQYSPAISGNWSPAPSVVSSALDQLAARTITAGSVATVTGSNPIFSSGGTNPNITISQSSNLLPGFLSSSDWNTFNSASILVNAATSLNTANAIVKRDALGGFSAGALNLAAAINMNGNLINGLGNPITAQDAATKNYVDTVAADGVAKGASVYATTGALAANIYNNGASGVGATLTGTALGALSIDGNAVVVGQRVLIKNEIAQANNGIYVVTATGSGAAVYVLTRAFDFNSSADIVDGSTTFITSGATFANQTWQLQVAGVVTVGTTALVFNQIGTAGISALTGDVSASGAGSVTATVNSVGGSSAFNINAATILANASTSANTASTIVRRDASGSFSAGTITATLVGNASNVTGIVATANGGTGQNFSAASGFIKITAGVSSTSTIQNADLPLSGVVAGAYTNTTVTVNSQGIVTGISSGSSSSGGSKQYAINNQIGASYTLALTDGYSNGNFPLLALSNASDQMVTVPLNASVAFPVGEQIDLTQQGAGRVLLSPAAGVTLHSADGTTLSAQYSYATLIQTFANVWTVVGQHLTALITATGGTITTVGNFKVHTFTSSGTFQVISGSGTVASLVVAGGGGGGGESTASGGGGGGGGFIYTTPGATYTTGSYTVTVGAGGTSPGSASGNNGGNSVFDVITATGGGGGAGSSSAVAVNGSSGGSGGGGNGRGGGGTGGTGTGAQGNAGGTGSSPSANSGGGGGGAGAVGGNAATAVRGNGGNGTANGITGSTVTYAGGGGGGGGLNPGTGGLGGTGGGGNADPAGGIGGSGTVNTGGGGAGGTPGGSGGSGVVIVTYQFQ